MVFEPESFFMSAAHNSVRRRLLLGGAAVAGLTVAGAAAGCAVMARADFGALPTGERLKRIQASPHWQDGSFHNLVPMELSASGRSRLEIMRDFLLDRNPQRFPSAPVPHIKTHFAAVPDNHMVWLGHSGFFIHWAGLKVLIDPALHQAFPVPGFYKPFPGTDIYRPEDMPDIDCLVITHDHWDHLDYGTVTRLKGRVRKVVCPLGVGEHFEYWGYEPERLVELDWNETATLGGGVTVHCLPARHFSGRGLRSNRTLWASFLVEAAGRKVYIGGDGGYGAHYADIGKRFPGIDLAVLENGQYNVDWRYIHTLPKYQHAEAEALGARRDEPLENARKLAEDSTLEVLCPMIGEVVEWSVK